MAGTIKGLTVRVGGDTTGFTKAMSDANKEIKTTQKELNEVNKALKLDPKNVDLLRQKQQILGEQIGNTTKKLDILKQGQQAFDKIIKEGGQVNQEEYKKLQREIALTESSLGTLKKEAKETNPNLVQLGESLKKAGEIANNTLKKGLDFTIAGVKAMAGACTTAITAVGGLAVKAGALSDDLNTMSTVTGLTTKQLQEFKYASDLIDVSTDTLAGSLKKLTSNMSTASKGSGDVYDTFKALGVEFKNADGTLRNSNEVFNDTIRALGKVKNETERDALAMKLFGKSATDLNPLIEGGIDTLEEMSKQANDLGLILSQEALDGANAFNDQLDILKANGQGLFQVIGTEVASSLTPAMEKVNAITMDVIKNLTTAMKEGGLSGLVDEASKQIGNLIAKLVENLPKVADFGVNIIKTLINTFKSNASQIGTAGAELVTTLVQRIL